VYQLRRVATERRQGAEGSRIKVYDPILNDRSYSIGKPREPTTLNSFAIQPPAIIGSAAGPQSCDWKSEGMKQKRARKSYGKERLPTAAQAAHPIIGASPEAPQPWEQKSEMDIYLSGPASEE
jgi:hypothetical protein